MTLRGLLILGFGGHARSVGDVALDLGIPALAFVDAAARPGEAFAGFPVHAAMLTELPDGWGVMPAIGDNQTRRRRIEEVASLPLVSLVSRRAYVGAGAIIKPGGFVAHHAHVGPMASIGCGAIVNTGAVIDHESRIGAYAHIAVNATVAGRCDIGRLVMIGAGATVIDGIRIADQVVIGAGATVVADIAEAGTYVGCPARRLRREAAP